MMVKLTAKYISPWIGNKAINLRRLAERGFRVPQTWVIPWEAYQRFRAGEKTAVLEELRREIAQNLDLGTSYAVRSSANIEDDLHLSFAGQFKTLLNVKGVDAIVEAVEQIWESVNSETAHAYQTKVTLQDKPLYMAVIIQKMVAAVYSGVAFSCNPLTGLNEVVIEAVKGEGTQLVQDGITPLRWVEKYGRWLEQPAQNDAPAELAREVAAGTRRIQKVFKKEIDLEWVYDGKDLYWVQMREITGLSKINIYSNRIARDMLPGIIKPLVWSVNIPLVNTVWVRLLSEVIGKNDIQPERLAKSFYYRTYFNMGVMGRIFELMGMPANGLEVMMGLIPKDPHQPAFKPGRKAMRLLPRMLVFAWDKWNFTPKFLSAYAGLKKEFAGLRQHRLSAASEKELLAEIDRLYSVVQRTAYFNIVIPLLMALYNNLLNSQLRKLGTDMASFDLMEGMEEVQDYDPNVHLLRLHESYCRLSPSQQEQISAQGYAGLSSIAGAEAFHQQFEQFIDRFGHLSNSGNDFSVIPWCESPDLLLKLVKDFRKDEEVKGDRVRFGDLKLAGMKRWWVGLLYRRARQYRLFRDQISSLYTLGYGKFRPYFLELGRRLAERGFLKEAADIFYLDFAQVRQIALGLGIDAVEVQNQVARHKEEIAKTANVILPTVIYGDEAPPIQPADSKKLTGIPTSRGYYCGKLKVVRGIEDFHKLEDRDVLVIPFTDVGWTPLFARAGAVISESGGMLSHSSIVAREYHIPAVVSVQGAMQLVDDTKVAVDGYRGEVIILEPLVP